jgi:hypothetical protein
VSAGIVLRIYRVSKPDGLAFVTTGRAHAKKYPSDEIHGGSLLKFAEAELPPRRHP